MKLAKKSLLCALVLLLLGCQQLGEKKSLKLKNHRNDYLESSLLASLALPPGLQLPKETENYPIPTSLPAPESLAPLSLEPPGFGQ